MTKKTFILVSKKKNAAAEEVDELLKHPDVEILDSLAGRFWQLSLPEALVLEWNHRMTDWALAEDKSYSVPKAHPLLDRLPSDYDESLKK